MPADIAARPEVRRSIRLKNLKVQIEDSKRESSEPKIKKMKKEKD
jgi:hypothetical protein